ncbi:cytochrome c maturation protein CcmE [bacterium]|nr:cytochrome c maturation protein CcmE [bacterium]
MAPKFVVTILLLVGGVGYLAVGGFQSAKSYYVTVDEMYAKLDRLAGQKMKVAGVVSENSIAREDGKLKFSLERNGKVLPVEYVGSDPVPDMFNAGVEAVVAGFYRDPVFEADHIQAKCASKYEAEYARGDGTAPAQSD